MASLEAVLYEKQGGIAHVTLNRPNRLNAYNLAMRDALSEILPAVRDDDEVGVMVLRGAGDRAFCAGADLTEFGTAPSLLASRRARWERDIWGLFRSVAKPILAQLHGFTLGSGCEMALFCDLRIAADDTRFAFPEVNYSIIPAAGGTQTLARAVGLGRAYGHLLTGEMFDAAEAYEIGLVNRVVPRAQLAETVEEWAHRLLARPRLAVRLAKEAIEASQDLTLDAGGHLERRLAALLEASPGFPRRPAQAERAAR